MAKKKPEPKNEVQKYLDIISAYEREFKKFETRAEKVLKRYRDEERRTATSQTRFNILWSNVQTLVPATFSRLPQPDVSRRFRDQDPVGRVASLILERALDFEVQHYKDYQATMKQCVYDRFLVGRGTAWARYEPHIKAVSEQLPIDGAEITEDVDEPQEELDYECAPVDYVHWKDFGHNVARTWEEVTQVWRRVYMSMPAKIERFGEKKAETIPIDAKPKDERYSKDQSGENYNEQGSWIFELWDKSEKCAYWFHKNIPDFLDERDDPLGLEEFFPCPRPLFATITNESLVPVADYVMYQDQARQLDTLADRIDGLAYMLQVKGVYDGSADPAVGRVFTEGDNGKLLPVKNYAAFAEKGGLKGAIDVIDLGPIAAALKEAYAAFEMVKQQIDELLGIADIVRAQTDPGETLGAQQLKGQYSGLRLREKQLDVAQFATELLRFKAQIMCAKFDPQTIQKIAGVDQLSPQDQQFAGPAMQLLLGDRAMNPDAPAKNPLRSFRIEVAADSLVQIDEQQYKQDMMEFVKANGDFLVSAGQVLAQAGPAAPALVSPIMEIWKAAATAFKVGKGLEGCIDTAADQVKQILAQQQAQPQPPDPKLQAAQIAANAKIAQTQSDSQLVPIKAQAEMAKASADVMKSQNAITEARIKAMTPHPVVQPMVRQ